MFGAIPPLLSTPSWRGVQLKEHRDNFSLPYICTHQVPYTTDPSFYLIITLKNLLFSQPLCLRYVQFKTFGVCFMFYFSLL